MRTPRRVIAGLTTGGGFGYLTRKYGWTCDNVISMEVVTAAGTVVRASATENRELFWCLRGGSGNFGIVASFEYKTYPVGPTILGGMMVWKAEDAGEVLRVYSELSAKAPRELTLVALMRIAPPAPWLPKEIHGKPIVGVMACYSGERIEDGEAIVAPLRALPGQVASTLVPRPYAQLQMMLDATQPKGRRYYWKSEYLAGIDPAMIEVYRARAATICSPHSAVILFQLGGALNELPADHSPVGNRDTSYVLNIAGAWDAAADDEANVAWARETWQALRPFSTGGVYVAALERKYDPENLFRHAKRFG